MWESSTLIREWSRAPLMHSCCRLPISISILGNHQCSRIAFVEKWAVGWSIGSSICLSTALTSCLPAPTLPLWPALTPSVRSDSQRRALFMERCVHPSVCHCAQLHLHLRMDAPVTPADVHRETRGSFLRLPFPASVVSLVLSGACQASMHAFPPSQRWTLSALPTHAFKDWCLIDLQQSYIRSVWRALQRQTPWCLGKNTVEFSAWGYLV